MVTLQKASDLRASGCGQEEEEAAEAVVSQQGRGPFCGPWLHGVHHGGDAARGQISKVSQGLWPESVMDYHGLRRCCTAPFELVSMRNSSILRGLCDSWLL